MTDDRPAATRPPSEPPADGGHTAPRQRETLKQRGSEMMDDYGYRILSAVAVLLLAVGTVAYHFIEDWSWVDSFYFSSVAVATVGFGDLVPTTDFSKLFTVFYFFSGLAVITSFLNVRLRRHAQSIVHDSRKAERKLRRSKKEKKGTTT